MVAAVFGVSEKIEDKDLLSVVVDGGDEAEIVTAHIEDGDGPSALYLYLIGVRKHAAGFDEILPRTGQHQPRPIVERSVGLGKPGSVVSQGGAFDQPHGGQYVHSLAYLSNASILLFNCWAGSSR